MITEFSEANFQKTYEQKKLKIPVQRQCYFCQCMISALKTVSLLLVTSCLFFIVIEFLKKYFGFKGLASSTCKISQPVQDIIDMFVLTMEQLLSCFNR